MKKIGLTEAYGKGRTSRRATDKHVIDKRPMGWAKRPWNGMPDAPENSIFQREYYQATYDGMGSEYIEES